VLRTFTLGLMCAKRMLLFGTMFTRVERFWRPLNQSNGLLWLKGNCRRWGKPLSVMCGSSASDRRTSQELIGFESV
jgi:hypothetical protein